MFMLTTRFSAGNVGTNVSLVVKAGMRWRHEIKWKIVERCKRGI